jgi:histone H3/H4
MTENTETQNEGGEGGSEVLVVASKVKGYIRAQSGFNTSSAVLAVLSDRIRQLCNQAVERAKSEGRKTVMDRDFM